MVQIPNTQMGSFRAGDLIIVSPHVYRLRRVVGPACGRTGYEFGKCRNPDGEYRHNCDCGMIVEVGKKVVAWWGAEAS